jgi:mono/diheme cytochrome c family protein
MCKRPKSLPLLLILSLFLPAVAKADAGKELFEKECASCHTIGGGDSGGPDLKGVAAKRPASWLERIIVEPDKLSADKDPVQVELVKKYGFEMPNLGISHDGAVKIIAYLKGGAAPAGEPARKAAVKVAAAPKAGAGIAAPAVAQPPVAPVVEQHPASPAEIIATPEMIAMGKSLFSGKKPFSKGGAPCAACHAVSYPGLQGGNLAADLTGLYTRMGEQGVRGVLKSLKFPVMKKVYADRQLTDEETAALVAFMKDAAAQKGGGGAVAFPLAGIAMFALFMVGLTLYKRRIR